MNYIEFEIGRPETKEYEKELNRLRGSSSEWFSNPLSKLVFNTLIERCYMDGKVAFYDALNYLEKIARGDKMTEFEMLAAARSLEVSIEDLKELKKEASVILQKSKENLLSHVTEILKK